jgi:hypothetical protein
MRIHLIFDQTSHNITKELTLFLNQFFRSDLVKFSIAEDTETTKNIPFTWNEIFQTTRAYRSNHPENQNDYFLYVMSGDNEFGWFAAQDQIDSKLGFVQSGNWELYEGIDAFSGTAYHLLAILFRMIFYGNLTDSQHTYHLESKGCLNDLVQVKSQVIHKLRSSYICPACVNKVKDSGRLTIEGLEFFNGSLKAISEIRNRLVKVDLGQISNLLDFNLIAGEENEMIIWLEDKEIPITLSRGWKSALYLFLLESKKGLDAKELLADSIGLSRLAKLYAQVKPTQTAQDALAILNEKIQYRVFQDFLDQTVCAIRKSLNESLKNFPELLDQLTIKTEGDLRVIQLDRSKILSKHLRVAC